MSHTDLIGKVSTKVAPLANRVVTKGWSENQVYTLQHGRGTRGFRSRMNGDWVSGPLELTDEELGANRRRGGIVLRDARSVRRDGEGHGLSGRVDDLRSLPGLARTPGCRSGGPRGTAPR